MSSSTASPITSIPLLQKVFVFSTIKFSRLSEFASVHSSWQDCVHNYSHGIFSLWMFPTPEPIRDADDACHREQRSHGGPHALPVDHKDEDAAFADGHSNRSKEVKRRLTAAFVRACHLGFRWLVQNILESPSRRHIARNHQALSDGTCWYDRDHFIIDPVHCNHYSGVPIFAAVSGKHHDIVRYLIAKTHGAVLGTCASSRAVQHETKSECEVDSSFVLDLCERTPLFNAAAVDPEMMEILIDAGCDYTVIDYAGDDVANYCASQGFVDSLRWLLEVKVPAMKQVELAMNPNSAAKDVDADEENVVEQKRNHEEPVLVIKKPRRALDAAAAVGMHAVMRYLIEAVGCKVSRETLLLAARSGRIDAIRAVLDGIRKIEGEGFETMDFSTTIRAIRFSGAKSDTEQIVDLMQRDSEAFPAYARKSTDYAPKMPTTTTTSTGSASDSFCS